mmetsp:Transcript_19147/g.22096  ORF Transcript_19147/g.22096 Transcript_19147/m.22096 type:complete len:137 (-) Transcript_19147:281-691(-)
MNAEKKQLSAPKFIDKAVQTFCLNDKFYFLISGGTNKDVSDMTNENWVYKLNLTERCSAAKFSVSRSHHSVVQFKDYLYAFGGIECKDRNQIPLNSIEKIKVEDLFSTDHFDAAKSVFNANSWIQVPSINSTFNFS